MDSFSRNLIYSALYSESLILTCVDSVWPQVLIKPTYIGTLIPAWISNHMPSKMWYKITSPFPNFNGCTFDVWNGKFHPTRYHGCNYISMQGLKLSHIDKGSPWNIQVLTAVVDGWRIFGRSAHTSPNVTDLFWLSPYTLRTIRIVNFSSFVIFCLRQMSLISIKVLSLAHGQRCNYFDITVNSRNMI